MEKLLIVGSGGLGRVVLEHASLNYECTFIDDGIEPGTIIDGTPVIGKTTDLPELHGEFKCLIVAIGNNAIREKLYEQATKIGYHFPNIIQQSAYISNHSTMGNGCIILNNVVVQNNTQIGHGVILNPGVEIHHDSIIGNNVVIYTNSVIRSLARIEDRAKIGSTLTIGNNVIIKEDEVIADGQTIT